MPCWCGKNVALVCLWKKIQLRKAQKSAIPPDQELFAPITPIVRSA